MLDGLRGVAVLLVITEHAGLIKNGFMGVDVFFVLSGFLISTLLFEEWERSGRISLRGFYIRRARRLLPAITLLALLAVAVDLFAYRLTGWNLGMKLASTFGFANNWVAGLSLDHGQALGAINPTWSLAQEEQFYLLWPLALIALLTWKVKPAQMLALLAGAIAAVLLLEPTLSGALAHYSTYYDPIDRASELLLGCAGSVLWRWHLVRLPTGATVSGPEIGDLHGRLRISRLVLDGVLLALAGAFAWLLLAVDPSDSRWVFLGAAGIALPALLVLIQAPGTLIGRVLCWGPLRWVGRISYCLYLVHLLIRNLLMHYTPTLTSAWAIFAITVAVSLAVAALSDRYIETPIRQGRFMPFTVAGRLAEAGKTALRAALERRESRAATQAARSPIRSSA